MFKTFIFTLIIISSTFLTETSHASETNGTIDNTSFAALVCHDPSCTAPTPTYINFKPTGVTPITITDTSIDGLAWGSGLGWINLNPTGSEGITVNPNTGEISGLAWSQSGSWINFRPSNSGTIDGGIPVGVSINAAGEFVGWGWASGPNGGWIKFTCTSVNTCVKTDWRSIPNRTVVTLPATGGSGGGTAIQTPQQNNPATTTPEVNNSNDLCLNLPRTQTVVPKGYIRDAQSNVCTLILSDSCSNIAGIQTVVPFGLKVEGGQCVPLVEEEVEKSKEVATSTGKTEEKKEEVVDLCANISGLQTVIPQGYLLQTGTSDVCVSKEVDHCPNIDGIQNIVPIGYFINENGGCERLTSVEEDKDADGLVDEFEDDKGEVNDLKDIKLDSNGDPVIINPEKVLLDTDGDGIGDENINIIAYGVVDTGNRMLFEVPFSENILGEKTYVDLISTASTVIAVYAFAVAAKFILALLL